MPKILLVEDDFPLMRLYQTALEADYEVIITATCKEAMQVANELKPDLIILDLNLPDAPGTALIQYVEQNPKLDGTRMIAMTGFSHLPKSKPSAKVVEVLSKPVTTTMLLRVVNTTLSVSQSAQT